MFYYHRHIIKMFFVMLIIKASVCGGQKDPVSVLAQMFRSFVSSPDTFIFKKSLWPIRKLEGNKDVPENPIVTTSFGAFSERKKYGSGGNWTTTTSSSHLESSSVISAVTREIVNTTQFLHSEKKKAYFKGKTENPEARLDLTMETTEEVSEQTTDLTRVDDADYSTSTGSDTIEEFETTAVPVWEEAEFEISVENYTFENVSPPTNVSYQVDLLEENCGIPLLVSRGGRIVGGIPANPSAFPWVVSVLYRYYHICGGSLITDQFLLTAGHCLAKVDPALLSVKSFAGLRRAKRVYIHPEFWLLNRDIGLIELESPFENLVPSCVSNFTHAPIGTKLLVLGWGLTKEGGTPSGDLLAAEIKVLQPNICESHYKGFFNPNMFCAGSPTGIPDTCYGDSGGPLLQQIGEAWHQIGIVSFGDGCGRKTAPGVYTKVDAFFPWIRSTVIGK